MLFNVIKKNDKLIGESQSENEEKEFVELNAIQEKGGVKVIKIYYFRNISLLEM